MHDAFHLIYFFHRFLLFFTKHTKKINPNNGPEFYKEKKICPLQKDTRDVLQVFDISGKIKCHTQSLSAAAGPGTQAQNDTLYDIPKIYKGGLISERF